MAFLGLGVRGLNDVGRTWHQSKLGAGSWRVLNEKDVPEDPGAWDRVAERLQRGLGVLVLFLPTNMEVFQYF